MMVVLTHAFGHPYVDGVGYGVIQSILDKNMTAVGLMALLFVAEDARHHDQPRFGRLGRHLLALALSRRHARRRLRRVRRHGSSPYRPDHSLGRDRRHGGDGRRGNRRGHDRDHHDLRNDARLRDHRSRHRRGRGGGRRPARADRRDDLHDQAAPPRPPHPQGAAHQSLSRQAGAGHHGAALHPRQGGDVAQRDARRGRHRRLASPSSSNATGESSASFRRARACGSNRGTIRTCSSTASSSPASSSAATSIS